MTRVVLLILDGVGIGALPDAGEYGDEGSDTLGNLSRIVELRLPFFERLGLGNIAPLRGVSPVAEPLGLVGRLSVRSAGKDTTVGHWEHMGLVTERPFPTYPQGFPDEVMREFEREIGRGALGNKTASGTAIIEELGEAHLTSGRPIVYTSADSVFQIAAHVGVVPLEELYAWCEAARRIMQGRHAVARVIARPFDGVPGAFRRTNDRRDFSLAPPSPTYLDLLQAAGVPVVALGKISEVFVGRGISAELKASSNDENLGLVVDLLRHRTDRYRFSEGMLFTNLVDFDMVWGHRNDVDGFAEGLLAVDRALPSILASLEPGDSLVVSADHGVDPTTSSTDHSREYVPLLLYPRPYECPQAVYEGTLADTGATIYAKLTGRPPELGGNPIGDRHPSRGWRAYTAAQPWSERPGSLLPGRRGQRETAESASYLRQVLGPAPDVALILGSGLSAALRIDRKARLRYRDIPHWAEGEVSGHPYQVALGRWRGRPLLFLGGRVHGYEGFDLSQLQLPVRTLAAWGVRRVLLSSACGAVRPEGRAGDVIVVSEVINLQAVELGGPSSRPTGLPATPAELAARVLAGGEAKVGAGAARLPETPPALRLSIGAHATVPGPQYETAAELRLLQAMGAATVSMSLAAEVRAAQETGLEVAALALIVNAGHTSHPDVLAGASEAASSFNSAVEAVLRCWGY